MLITDRLISAVAHAVVLGDTAMPVLPLALLDRIHATAAELLLMPGCEHQALRQAALRIQATVLSLRGASGQTPELMRRRVRDLRAHALAAARLEEASGLIIPPPPALPCRRLVPTPLHQAPHHAA